MAELVRHRKIWSRADHNAFTDLLYFRKRWYCTFREAEDHAESTGRVRLLESADGVSWKSAALLSEPGVDLRDPKLSLTPRRRLMLLAGGTLRSGGGSAGRRPSGSWPAGRRPRVFFSADGRRWSAPRTVLGDGDWLWRVTWHEGRAYGVSYRVVSRLRWAVDLFAAEDGLAYRKICALAIPGRPNETTLRFEPDGRAITLVRREGGDRQAWIGSSAPPYMVWAWHPAGLRLGGPNFLRLPDGSLWAAGRAHREEGPRTLIARITDWRCEPSLELPSGGDCGYPGLAWRGGLLWVSYYSSHDGKASIYLAQIRLP